jgi:hypothetical protein
MRSAWARIIRSAAMSFDHEASSARGRRSSSAVSSAKWKKPVVLMELGYPAHKGAMREPWKADSSLPLDEGIQARAFEGTFRALSGAPFVRGVFIWKWFSGGEDNPHEKEPYDPEGKAAEKIIARWFVR